ncbi:MAG: ATP-grasp domain-containing protein [bacterium]|nr:ATP-grasp domain-containing protein [bacterium]
MQQIRILMTCIGGLVTPGMIKNLRESIKGIYIVGVNMSPEAAGFSFVDKSYTVFSGKDMRYPKQILKIARKEKIDLVIPLSDEEMLSLSKAAADFAKAGIKVVCSDHNIIKIAQDKALMLQYLKAKGVLCPKFRVPNNLQELKRAVKDLGYPKKPVVFKPRNSRGARGFWLLNAKINKQNFILKSRDRQEITLEWLLEALENKKNFPKILVMEYLPGKDFNVDVLALKGESIYVIPNQRLVPKAGPGQVGLVKKDRQVQKYVAQIIKVFGFDYYVNVEVAYRLGRDTRPLIYEINPRISAPIIVNKQAGVDILKYGIDLALGRKIDQGKKFNTVKMVRYWQELFFKKD